MRNVIGRENLITCGRMNELTHGLWTEYRSVAKAFQQNRTRQHYTTLPGSTESYGDHTQTYTFENNANLLAYFGKNDCCTPRRMAFKALLNTKALLKLSLRLLLKKTDRTAATKTWLCVLSI